ncbi:hypothetical protein ACIQZG_09430 [Lysinibacillus sp. NPDC096418]|uniref:hypothetical protein n=1 Tax=Lysinibacillus sp. NPDC096418 TaxID=3364138 RepID=UPI0038146E4E
MNPCKKNCSCERCKKCGIPSRVIKAVEECEIPLPQEPPPQPPPPAFANFFLSGGGDIFLDDNEAIPWNSKGETSGITLDPDNVTIRVSQAGMYNIDFIITGGFASFLPNIIVVAIFVNDIEVNPILTRFGAINNEGDRFECIPISGGAIVPIPAGGTVQLRNVGGARFTTCGGTTFSSSIKLIKII